MRRMSVRCRYRGLRYNPQTAGDSGMGVIMKGWKNKKSKKSHSFSYWQLLFNFIVGVFFGPISLTVFCGDLPDFILILSSIAGAFAFSGFYWMIYKPKKCEDQPSKKRADEYFYGAIGFMCNI